MKNAVVLNQIFPSRISECKRKAKELNICQKGNKISPPVWGSAEQSILNMQPSMPRDKHPTPSLLQKFISLRKFPQLALCTPFSQLTSAPGGQETQKCVLSNCCVADWEQQEKCHRHPILQPGWLMYNTMVFLAEKKFSTHLVEVPPLALSLVSPQFGVFPRGTAECGEGFLSYRQGDPESALLF